MRINHEGGKSRKEIKMKKYIVDLTNTIIRENHLDHMFDRCKAENSKPETFLSITQMLVETSIRDMRPETHGKILGSLEIGELWVKPDELRNNLRFFGDAKAMLRDLTAWALTYVIRDRLGTPDPNRLGFEYYTR
jgi:hypothetical protein